MYISWRCINIYLQTYKLFTIGNVCMTIINNSASRYHSVSVSVYVIIEPQTFDLQCISHIQGLPHRDITNTYQYNRSESDHSYGVYTFSMGIDLSSVQAYNNNYYQVEQTRIQFQYHHNQLYRLCNMPPAQYCGQS